MLFAFLRKSYDYFYCYETLASVVDVIVSLWKEHRKKQATQLQ